MSAAIIGALRVVLGADTASFEDGLKKASSGLASFGKMTSAVAVGNVLGKALEKAISSVGDFVAATFSAIDAMDKMGKESQKVGISVGEMSKLTVAAKLADVEIGELSKSIVQLSKRLVEGADSSTDPAKRALQALGIAAKDFVNLGTEKKLEVIADRFSQFRDSAEKTTAAVSLFGRAGANLIPLLNEGSEGFKKAADQAQKLNLVMNTESAAAAQRFNDNMKLVGLGLTQGIFNPIAEKLLPAFEKLSESFVDLTTKITRWVKGATASEKVVHELESAKKKLNIVTDEQARKEEQLREKMLSLQVQTMALRGEFVALAPGLIEAGISLKMIKGNAETLPKTFEQLSPAMQRLNQELFNFKAQQITQETLDPWELYNQKMLQLQVTFQNSTLSAEAFGRRAAEIAGKLQSEYASAAASMAGSFGEAFSAIGGENKSWAHAAKIAMATQALFSTYAASAQALNAGVPPFNFVAAAAVLAKGLSLVAAIKGTAIGFATGGAFQVPGSGGMDSMPVSFMATPGERVTVETPDQQRRGRGQQTTIVLQGSSFHFREVRDLIHVINEGIRDGLELNVVQRG